MFPHCAVYSASDCSPRWPFSLAWPSAWELRSERQKLYFKKTLYSHVKDICLESDRLPSTSTAEIEGYYSVRYVNK